MLVPTSFAVALMTLALHASGAAFELESSHVKRAVQVDKVSITCMSFERAALTVASTTHSGRLQTP